MKAKGKKQPESTVPIREIPAHVEACWINDTTGEVRLRIATGGYRGEWGKYCETSVDVMLKGDFQ